MKTKNSAPPLPPLPPLPPFPPLHRLFATWILLGLLLEFLHSRRKNKK